MLASDNRLDVRFDVLFHVRLCISYKYIFFK